MIEKVILDEKFENTLVSILKEASRASFQLIITFYKKLIQLSPNITKSFCNSTEFLRELVDRLGQGGVLSDTNNSENGNNKKGEGRDSISYAKKCGRIECANPSALVQKEILEILYYLLSNNSNYKQILNAYNLYPMLINILQNAQNDELVILEEIAMRLLKLHAN